MLDLPHSPSDSLHTFDIWLQIGCCHIILPCCRFVFVWCCLVDVGQRELMLAGHR